MGIRPDQRTGSSKYQFYPKLLRPENKYDSTSVETTFRAIAAGVKNNLAISLKKGKVFEFGETVLRAEL